MVISALTPHIHIIYRSTPRDNGFVVGNQYSICLFNMAGSWGGDVAGWTELLSSRISLIPSGRGHLFVVDITGSFGCMRWNEARLEAGNPKSRK